MPRKSFSRRELPITYGDLTAVEYLSGSRYRCQCACGGERIAKVGHFHTGKVTSCGCKTTRHGLHSAPEYRAWINMKSRCYNEKSPGFHRYGGRGIAVCDRWLDSFEDFLADVGPRPSPKHSLDRWPDQDGDYEPNNCRWATQTQQTRNFSANRIVQIHGRAMPLAEAVEASSIKYNTVLYRLKRGWPLETALSQPTKKGFRACPV